MAYLGLFALLLLSCVVDGKNEFELKSFLKGKHARGTRPVSDPKNVVQVKLDIALRAIVGLDLKNQVLKTNIWIRIYWTDENLQWNETEYGGLKSVNFAPSQIWVPDLVLYNSASEDASTSLMDVTMQTSVVVKSNGAASWFCPLFLASDCSVDIAMFPFDRQACPLQFGLWTYDGLRVNLTKEGDAGDTSNTAPSGEWILHSFKANRREIFYPCCPGVPYPDVIYTLDMQRRTKFYLINLIIPGVMIGLVACLSFVLPPECGERVGLGITNLLAMMVFLLLVFDTVPATSDAVPIVGKVFMSILVICGMTLFITCIILIVSFMEGSSPDDCPFWVRVIVNQYIASILCIEGEQWRIKVFLQSGIYFITGGKSSVSVQINDPLPPSKKNSIRTRSDLNLNLNLMDFDNADQTRLLRERQVEGAGGKSDLQFLREKYESEDLEKACQEEYAKCVKVLDRLSLVLCIFGLYLVLHYLLAQPEQLWVP